MKKTHSPLICVFLIAALLFSSCATSKESAKTISLITAISGGGIMLGMSGYSVANEWSANTFVDYMYKDQVGKPLTIVGSALLSIAVINLVFQVFDYSDKYWRD